MFMKELELPGLQLADPNAEYTGNQTIFIDFDGASEVSYDNDVLGIHIDNIDFAGSDLNSEQISNILNCLNYTFAGTGVNFTASVPVNEEYSTIYVGQTAGFSGSGSLLGLAETIDAGNQIKNDDAFVFSDRIDSVAAITETITHEAAHLLGFVHVGDRVINDLSDFAAAVKLLNDSTKLTASDGAENDCFGGAVAVSGSTVVAGAYGDDDGGNYSGSTYIYRWDGNSYAEHKLTASDAAAGDYFGHSVAISGDTVAVGANYDDDHGSNCGSIYVYHWDGSLYAEHKLTASDATAEAKFGYSVAVSGDLVVTGAWGGDFGSAYVYRWDGSAYSECKLTASDSAEGDYFGQSVAVSGDNVVVGADGDDDGGSYSGSAYVYRWNGNSYTEYKLTASDAADHDYFGRSVAVSGDTVVVGAFLDDDNGENSGSVYVYRWNGSSYAEYKLTASDGMKGDSFGHSVAIAGDVIVVGANFDDDNGEDSGSAYVYRWDGSSYTEYKLTAYDGDSSDYFGSSVSVSGDNVVVGASGRDDNGSNSGCAYVFNWNGSSYTQYREYKLTASDGVKGDNFGYSVAVSGGTVVAGALYDDDIGRDAGCAYAYRWNGSSYTEYKLTASDGEEFYYFGKSVAVDDDTVIVGAYKGKDRGVYSGSAYVYRWKWNVYSEYKLTASDGALGDNFGCSVAVSGDTMAVGADGDDDNGEDSGSVYVYNWNGSLYSEHKLTASDGMKGDKFGKSVAVSGYTVVVGASENDSKGIDSGSAYVYRWKKNSYSEYKLSASDGEKYDSFGWSVGIDGDVVVVGAWRDDDNGSDSGSAYVYRWNGSSYSEYKLTASDAAENDRFGISVAVSGDTVVIGASGDESYSGSVYVYHWNGSSYIEYKLNAPNLTQWDFFGNSVAIAGDRVVVGALGDNDCGINSGSTYVFNLNDIIDTVAPSIPAGLTSTVTKSNVALDWADSTDNYSGIKDYIVEYANNTSFIGGTSKTVTASELSLSDLANDTYYWRVKAADNEGNTTGWSQTGNFSISEPKLYVGDFNGDSCAGLFCWHPNSDSVTCSCNGAWVDYSDPGAGWSINGCGDFNGDGIDDLLLKNSQYDNLGAWTMNGDGTNGWLELPTLDFDTWSVAGCGDFDGNGVDDLLLFWKEYNYLGLWTLDSAGNHTWRPLGQFDADNWAVSLVGDFNGDSRSDVLLYNEAAGIVGAWLTRADASGVDWATVGNFEPGVWEISGIGDFDGNGIDDVMLEWTEYNYLGAWTLNGSAGIAGWANLDQFNREEWLPAGCGDCNGDGIDDVLLEAVGSDCVGARLVNNGAVTGWLTVVS